MGTTINDNESDEQIQRPVAGFNVSDIESQKYAGDWKDKWERITVHLKLIKRVPDKMCAELPTKKCDQLNSGRLGDAGKGRNAAIIGWINTRTTSWQS